MCIMIEGGEGLKKIVLMVVVLLFVLSFPIWASDISTEIARIASALKGEYTLGNPVIVGELTILPVVKTSVLSLGNGEKSSFQWLAGGISLEPVALVVIKNGELRVYNVGGPETGIGEIVEALPGVEPQIKAIAEDAIRELMDKGKESLKNKNFAEAKSIFEDIVRSSPDLADAHALLGQVLGELAQSSTDLNHKIRYGMEAFREFARALEIEPDNPYALIARGYARLIAPPPLGGVDVAIEDFSRAVEKDPKLVEAYLGLAEAYQKKGDKEKADENYKKVLELDPENKQAREGLSKTGE